MTDFAFLHGGGQGSWVWEETIGGLQGLAGGSARCLALDVPGCGAKRDRDTSDLGLEDIARELVADIEVAGMRDAVLVGHSQAGTVMPLMAKLAPEFFARHVHVSCTALPDGVNLIQHRGVGRYGENDEWVGWPLDPDEVEADEMYRVMFCNDMDERATTAFLAKLGRDMWPQASYTHDRWIYDQLSDLPTTFVICERDMAVPVEWQERYAARLHADRIVRIDAGHQVMNTRPDRLAEVLLAESHS